MSILTKFFEKRGVKPEDLTPEEKETVEGWKKILSEEDVTLDTILVYCTNSISVIENQFKDLENSKEKIERLVLLHTVYSSLKKIITSPKSEKENLEKYLTSLL